MLFPFHPERGKLGYADFFATQAKELSKRLKHAGISQNIRNAIFDSGYILWEEKLPAFKYGPLTPVVHDGFYGTKWGCGFIPLPAFLQLARLGKAAPVNKLAAPAYVVASVDEIEAVLRTERHRRFVESGRMCFRGQTKDYFVKRPFPNPSNRDGEGRERVILPSFWRNFLSDFNRRPFRDDPEPIVSSMDAGDLIFQGIEDWPALEDRRKSEYPYLDRLKKVLPSQNPIAVEALVREVPECCGFQNLPKQISDARLAEYCQRWIDHVLMASIGEESILLEQHYGLPTCGLDVTYDLKIATFFATNIFQQKDKAKNIGDFKQVDAGMHEGAIYCFVFEDPPVFKTEEMVKKLRLFQHCVPVRPLRQQCALPYFHAENINEAAVELDAVFCLGKNFNAEGIPSKSDAFPTRKEDPFYDALLKLKERNLRGFDNVVEYQFEDGN